MSIDMIPSEKLKHFNMIKSVAGIHTMWYYKKHWRTVHRSVGDRKQSACRPPVRSQTVCSSVALLAEMPLPLSI